MRLLKRCRKARKILKLCLNVSIEDNNENWMNHPKSTTPLATEDTSNGSKNKRFHHPAQERTILHLYTTNMIHCSSAIERLDILLEHL